MYLQDSFHGKGNKIDVSKTHQVVESGKTQELDIQLRDVVIALFQGFRVFLFLTTKTSVKGTVNLYTSLHNVFLSSVEGFSCKE